MSGGDAVRMIGADILKLRRSRGTMIAAVLLTVGTVLIGVAFSAVLHANNPESYGPAGGRDSFFGLMEALGFFTMLVGGIVGINAGGSDVRVGVFRDLVATGRSRWALFASRYPAALIVVAIVATIALGIGLAAAFGLADGTATPTGGDVLGWVGHVAAMAVFGTAVGVGLGSLLGMGPGPLTVFLAWALFLGPIIGALSFLGPVRHLFGTNALQRLVPTRELSGELVGQQFELSSLPTAGAIVALWIVVFLIAGAVRTKMRDA